LDQDRFDFAPARLPREAYSYRRVMADFGETKARAKAHIRALKDCKHWRSSLYQVAEREVPCPGFGLTLTHLSIKRNDREAFHDWRELQAIKNAICGPEREAVELYPAESRLIDTSNQYHLFVLPAGKFWPFGFEEREVTATPGGAAKQRPFDAAYPSPYTPELPETATGPDCL
jgi:hypothetical protein